MRVKHLRALLMGLDPEKRILVRLDGSIYGTDNADEHEDYNIDPGEDFYILAGEWEEL